MDFNIKVEGDFQEIASIGQLSRELVEWTRVLPNDVVNEINDLLREQIIENSSQSIAADGHPFQELEDKYAKEKSGIGFGQDADLHFYKRAFDNFEIKRDAAGASARNRSVGYFTNRNQSLYMSAHQTGDSKRRTVTGASNPLPQRKFFPDDEDLMNRAFDKFREKVEVILIDYLNRLNERKARRGS